MGSIVRKWVRGMVQVLAIGKEGKVNRKRQAGWKSGKIATGVLLVLLLAGVVYAATVTIDSFNEGTQTLRVDDGVEFGIYAYKTVDYSSGDILGDERDTQLTWVGGNAEVVWQIDRSGTSNYSAWQAGDMTFKANITWDGNDNNAEVLDPVGLRGVAATGVDLTNGNTNSGIRVAILNDDQPADLKFSAYTDSTRWSEKLIELPGDASSTRMDIVFPFDSFVQQGSSGAVDWENLGALVLDLDASSINLDLTIDYIEADSDREYGDLPSSYGDAILDANHIPQGLRLGHNCDAEADHHASDAATGDDTSEADDEDGVAPSSLAWSVGSEGGEVKVIVAGCANLGGCYVNGWIDWDGNNQFSDTSDQILADQAVSTDGTQTYSIEVPSSFTTNKYYYARFRICGTVDTCDSPTTSQTDVLDGEIEDYRWWLGPTAVDLASFTALGSDGTVSVDWATTNENDLVGFNLWRNIDASGPDTQLNATLIEAQKSGTPFGSSYSYQDTGLVNGTTYYYWLESVEVGDVRTWHGPASAMPRYRLYLPTMLRR